MKKIISILLAVSMLVSLAACSQKQGGGSIDGAVQNDDNNSAFASKYKDLEEIDPTAVLWSDNFTISVSMFTYFFNSLYHNYLDSGTSGIDETVSLKEQTYSGATTWFEYLARETANNVQIKMFLAEEAVASGMTLTDEEYADIDSEITKIGNNATVQDISTAANIKFNYGDKVNEATVRKCMEFSALADKYNQEVLDPKYVFDEADYDEFFNKNPKDYLAINYLQYIIPAETGSDEVTAQFKACKNSDEFAALVKSRLPVDYPDQKVEEYDQLVSELYTYNQYRTENSKFAEWAYEDGRKVNEVYTYTQGNGITYVAMILPASNDTYSEVLYKDITPVHNVYAIAFLESDYDSADKAHEVAQSVYEMAKGGSDIVSLCTMYNGGSMSNVMLGDAPTGVEEWIFDDARKTDEVGIIKVNGVGSYVIKMRADGGATWQYRCAVDMVDKIYQDDLTAFSEKYKIGQNNEAVESITEIAGTREV